MIQRICLIAAAVCLAHFCGAGETQIVRARYLVLSALPHMPPPFASVDFVRGPVEQVEGKSYHWWQLEARADADQKTTPLFVMRGLTSGEPLALAPVKPVLTLHPRSAPEAPTSATPTPMEFARYLVRVPELNETLEYRDRHSGRALLPAWKDFERWFVPRATEAAHFREGVPETCQLLGHTLTLIHVGHNETWEAWHDVKVLDLDRELLVGTGRNFKDKEGHRLPQKPERTNYTYIPFVEDDYRVMIEAGINLFTIQPEQEIFVREQPVFYLRGPGGKPALRFPADFYRSNYVGSVMFMDEPSIIITGDKTVSGMTRHFSDAASLIEQRTHRTYFSNDSNYGSLGLQDGVLRAGVNFGEMTLVQWDYPSWETLYETTFYQMKGGGNGLVHEGRYKLESFDNAVKRATGIERKHTASELLQWHYATLRGGTRPFGKFWGTAIYGQCDPALAPEAVTRAYDMGARYIWFWTSDHDHHVPWPEQVELAKTIKAHAQAHPRPSIFGPPQKIDTAIVIPNGYFLSLESLWWVRVLDKERQNEESRRYRRMMQRAFAVAHECVEQGRSFDITVDDGRAIEGYRNVVRLNGEP